MCMCVKDIDFDCFYNWTLRFRKCTDRVAFLIIFYVNLHGNPAFSLVYKKVVF